MKKRNLTAVFTALALTLNGAAILPVSPVFAAETETVKTTVTLAQNFSSSVAFNPADSDSDPDATEWKGLWNDENQGGKYELGDEDYYDKAVEAVNDEHAVEGSLKVLSAKLTYKVTATGTVNGVQLMSTTIGFKASDPTTPVGKDVPANGEEITSDNTDYWIGDLTDSDSGERSITFSEGYNGCDWFGYFSLDIGGNGKKDSTLKLDVTKAELTVSYEKQKEYGVTGTEKLVFSPDNVYYGEGTQNLNPLSSKDYWAEGTNFALADWGNWSELKGKMTVEQFFGKYKSMEIAFNAFDIEGSLQVVPYISTWVEKGDESYEDAYYFDPQTIKEGLNTVTVNFPQSMYFASSKLNSIIFIVTSASTAEGASFALGNPKSKLYKSTGTKTLDLTADYFDEAKLIHEDWCAPGEYVYCIGLGETDESSNGGKRYPVKTIAELYSAYNKITATINVKNPSSNTLKANFLIHAGPDDEHKDSVFVKKGLPVTEGENKFEGAIPDFATSYEDICYIEILIYDDKAGSFVLNPELEKTDSPSIPTITPITPSGTTDSEATKPTEEFNTSEKPLDKIMEEAKPDTVAKIDVDEDSTNVGAAVLIQAKDKKISLELNLENGVKWTIDTSTIGDNVTDINININLNTNTVPTEAIRETAKSSDTMQISLAHNGNFGFSAEISIPVEKKYEGKTANIYHYNEASRLLEFVSKSVVTNSYCKGMFTHASDYVIIFTDESLSGAEQTTADTSKDPDSNLNTGVTGNQAGLLGFMSVSIATVFVLTVFANKKKNK